MQALRNTASYQGLMADDSDRGQGWGAGIETSPWGRMCSCDSRAWWGYDRDSGCRCDLLIYPNEHIASTQPAYGGAPCPSRLVLQKADSRVFFSGSKNAPHPLLG